MANELHYNYQTIEQMPLGTKHCHILKFSINFCPRYLNMYFFSENKYLQKGMFHIDNKRLSQIKKNWWVFKNEFVAGRSSSCL